MKKLIIAIAALSLLSGAALAAGNTAPPPGGPICKCGLGHGHPR